MKSYREKELKWYIFAYLFLLVGVCSPELFSAENADLVNTIEKLFTSTLLAGVVCTLSFVFDCLYTVTAKEKVIFLGFTKMPGKTIFTRISEGKLNDIRIDVNFAREQYKEIINSIPSNKKEREEYENFKWNSLSRNNEKDPRVKTSHRDFLLCRDLYTTTTTMFILTAVGMLFKMIQFSWIPLIYLIIMLMLTNIAAHFKAHRFVNNIIAADLSTKLKKK